MSLLEVLSSASFGQRVAEEEADDLHLYFVETDNWRKLVSGDVDIIYGPKGSGKSALYSLLVKNTNRLFDEGKLLLPGENPKGAPAFNVIAKDPPKSEDAFIGLWKLYFLSLLNSAFTDYGIHSEETERIKGFLQEERLIPAKVSLAAILANTYEYVKGFFTREVESVETGLNFDVVTQLPTGVSGKITFRQPGGKQSSNGFVVVDELLADANEALRKSGYSVWILLDRLDVAFIDDAEIEKNALRALFRAYLDLLALESIKIKVFLRTDIWRRITSEGFREASHITRHVTIGWTDTTIKNLIVRRLLKNKGIADRYGVSAEDVLADVAQQDSFFRKALPDKIDSGEKKPLTFDWIVSRTSDGTKGKSPREIIHFLNSLRQVQVKRLETGHKEPEDATLFDRQSFKDALPEVSTVRLEQTLYAEYPKLKQSVEKLRGEKTSQTPTTLSGIWGLSEAESDDLASSLVEIGFFEKRGDRTSPIYWVPFLYRDALELSQGSAE